MGLFQSYPLPLLTDWARRLKYFRVVAAEFQNSGSTDYLEVHFAYSSPEELKSMLATLNIPLDPVSPGTISPRAGQSYTTGQKIEFEIEDLPGMRQPGHCQVAGQYLFVWAEKGRLRLIASTENGPPDVISEEEVRTAEQIERLLIPLADKIIDPPSDDPDCFCPKYYPNAFPHVVKTAN